MTYAISDLHGCYKSWLALLREIQFADEDQIYVLGDIVDRGPEPMLLLQDMMVRTNVYPIVGNHDFAAFLSLKFLTTELTDQSIQKMEENKEIIKPSGSRKKDWIDLKEPILIAIYETDNRVNTSNAIYNSSTHIGLTFNKNVTSKNRLKDGDRIYNITGVNPQGRLNQVFLKVIENV